MPALRKPHFAAIGAVVVVVVVGYLMGFAGGGGAAEPAEEPPPVFEDLGLFEPAPPDDDRRHFLVDVSGLQLHAASTEATPVPPEIEVSSGVDATTGLELDRLVGQPGQARLMPDTAGNIWAVYPDGRRILVFGASDAPAVPAPDTQPEPQRGVLEILEDDRDVFDVWMVDDTTLAVVTSYNEVELAAVIGADVEVTVDQAAHAFENDPYFDQQWALENMGQSAGYVADADVDITDAWPKASGGVGIVVAVLDTGVDFSHPDLAGSSWVNDDENCSNGVDDDGNGYIDDCFGWDFVNRDAGPWDGNNHYHGTHVAGIAAARRDSTGIAGVAPGATIMDLRVLDTRGSGYSSWFGAAIRYAVDNGADVINMSLGTQPGTPRTSFGYVEQAIQYARDNGVLVVAAAGNSNVDIDGAPVWPASFAPLYDNVITIASTDSADGRSSFSNYGVATVTMGAPGSHILSTVPDGAWKTASGTSMATPMVAGAAALLLGDLPEATPQEVESRLVAAGDQQSALSGRLINPVRLNVGQLYENLGAPIRVDASGLDAAYESTGVDADLHIRVNDTAMLAGRDFAWQARLLMSHDGSAYGIVDHDVAVGGATYRTDASGLVPLTGAQSITLQPALGTTGITIGLETSLPSGSYALVVEAAAADGSGLVAPPQALFFEVQAGSPPSTTAPAPAPSPAPTPSPTPSEPAPAPAPATPGQPTPGQPSPTAPQPEPPQTQQPSEPAQPTQPGPAPTTTVGGAAPVPSTTAPQPGGSPQPDTPPTGPDPAPVTTEPSSSPSPVPGDSTPAPTQTTVAPAPAPESAPSPAPAPAPAPTPNPGAGPSPDTQPPAPVVWALFAISPGAGETNASAFVTLTGLFPQLPHVWFGDTKATVLSGGPTKLVVEVPRTRRAGAVDVELRVGSDVVLSSPGGFVFYDAGSPTPAPPPSTTIVAPVEGTPPEGSPDPADGTPTTQPADEAPTTTPSDPSRWYEPGDDYGFGSPLDLPGGLRGAPLTSSGPLADMPTSVWSSNRCVRTSCRAVSL